MWTDFSEVCVPDALGDRSANEITSLFLFFLFFPCRLGRLLPSTSTLTLNLSTFFSLSSLFPALSSTSTQTVHPRHRRPAQVQGPPRRLSRVPPPPQRDREAQRGLQGAEEGQRRRGWQKGRGNSSGQEALAFSFLFPLCSTKYDTFVPFFPPIMSLYFTRRARFAFFLFENLQRPPYPKSAPSPSPLPPATNSTSPAPSTNRQLSTPAAPTHPPPLSNRPVAARAREAKERQ